MKTKLNIEIETKNMSILEDGQDITLAIEEQIHNAIQQWIKYNLSEETLNEVILTNSVPDFEFLTVDEFTELSDYGDLKIKVNSEIVTNIKNKEDTTTPNEPEIEVMGDTEDECETEEDTNIS